MIGVFTLKGEGERGREACLKKALFDMRSGISELTKKIVKGNYYYYTPPQNSYQPGCVPKRKNFIVKKYLQCKIAKKKSKIIATG